MNKKIDVIVEARTSSTRLPGKILFEVLERPLLELMIERLRNIKLIDDIIVATTIKKEDDIIVSLCNKLDIPTFRGSENDVLGRVLNASKEFNTEIIVEITSDNPLVDPNLCDEVIKSYINNCPKFDIVSHHVPLGLCNAHVFSANLLGYIDKITKHPTDREHVVNFFMKNPDDFEIFHFEPERNLLRPELRLTMDYKEDYEVIKSIYENLYTIKPNFTSYDIIKYLDNNPKIKNLNKDCIQAKYNY
jgi:spore coat polysaccharide biosynthesis protein SpsF